MRERNHQHQHLQQGALRLGRDCEPSAARICDDYERIILRIGATGVRGDGGAWLGEAELLLDPERGVVELDVVDALPDDAVDFWKRLFRAMQGRAA